MNVERDAELTRRVALYGALADPTRLQVIDLLTLGDASSSELGARLGTPLNLLAHHLGILAEAGLVRRQRSEGDGRRSYWQLVPHELGPIGSPPVREPQRVVFVCTANTARSHLAAALWRTASDVPVSSAGTHPAARIAAKAAAVARRHHLDLPDIAPQHVGDVLAAGDLVVTVCDRAHEELADEHQIHWSVPDPVVRGDRAAFDRAYDDLARRVHRLAPLLATAS